ncbi:unnamed protein product [Effrenium voratum]|nr:unnamed protein product [Effrenium voratum]
MALVEMSAQSLQLVYSLLAPLWVELSFLLFFSLGYFYLRAETFQKGKKVPKAKQGFSPNFRAIVRKTIEAEAASGNALKLLEAWRAEESSAPTPKDLLKPVVQAFLDADVENIDQVIEHLHAHKESLGSSWACTLVLDTVARSGNVKVMMQLWDLCQKKLNLSRSCSMYEVILGGFASAGHPEKVKDFEALMSKDRLKLSPRGHSLIIKGFLKNGLVGEVLPRIVAMTSLGHLVPAFAVAQFLRVAAEQGQAPQMYEKLLENKVALGTEAVTVILEECVRLRDPKLARRVEQAAREAKVSFSVHAYDAMLKTCAEDCDVHAIELFKEMQAEGHSISEGLCVGLLARCADGKFLSFAEEVVRFVRAGPGMSIAVYSGLMKVYAYSGMYGKACDLYDQIRSDGLEPDTMMYGCLMKFSVECGRTALSQELSEKLSVLDIQNYMSLIKAAGRDRDVDRAFSIIQRLRENDVKPDAIAFNCVLDVCVKAGDLSRARKLLQEMKDLALLDIITYNTLLKGYCSQGDIKGAKDLLAEMTDAGYAPNDVSYNCILNVAVNKGSFEDAWDTISKMEQMNVRPDHYTVSIMLKALKRAKGSRDVQRCLGFLDRSQIDPCSDEILMNTVLETYIRHKELKRLESLLSKFEQSSLRPSVPTYGSIIKAYANLKRPEKCWHYWNEMQNQRGLEPNDIVYGCMLDALVCNGQVDEAVKLFENSRIKPNAVLCSILVKGFTNSGQTVRAMALWHEMREKGVKMNTAACNAFVDAQARVGNMEEVLQIVEAMALDGCQPDGITHSTIVKGYAMKGDLDKAMEVLRSMQASGVYHDAIVYNTILDGCSKHRRPDLVDKVLDSMDKHRISPTNFTLGILVKFYSRQKQLDKAFQCMSSLPKRGNFVPNCQVWSCLMGACLLNGSPNKALHVFRDMRAAGQSADTRACTSLVSGLVRMGQLKEAVQVVDEVCQGRCSVDQDCLESLLAALAQKGLREEVAKPLLDRLRKAQVDGLHLPAAPLPRSPEVPISGRLMAATLPSSGNRQK